MLESEKKHLKEKLEFILDDLDIILKLEEDSNGLDNTAETDKINDLSMDLDTIKNVVYEIFDIGKIFNIQYDEKFNKYLKGYRHSSILKILYNSYHLDKILDKAAYMAGLERIEEFVASENKYGEFLNSNLKI